MIRKKYSSPVTNTVEITRKLPNKPLELRLLTYEQPLDGSVQIISDSKVAYEKVVMPRAKRVRHDPFLNVLKKRQAKLTRLGSRLQPFKMNPVLIQNVVSECTADEDLTLPGSFGAICTISPGLDIQDSKYRDLSRPTVATLDSRLEQRAILNCLSKLSSPKNLDAGVGILELKSTLEFLRSPLKGAMKLFNRHKSSTLQRLNKVKQHRRATAREFVNAASDTWLGYRYAFRPLAQDITGVMIEMSEKLSTNSEILRRVSGRAQSDSIITIEPLTQTTISATWNIYLQGSIVRTRKQTVTAVQLYKFKPYFEDAINLASLGLSPTQLLSTAWEMIPFSFVVDWGVNIGTWLRAWEPKPWIEYLGSCVSTVTNTSLVNKDFKISCNGNTFLPYSGGNMHVKQLSRVVKVLTLPRSPLISEDVLNLSRSLDTLSLAWKPTSKWLTNFIRRK